MFDNLRALPVKIALLFLKRILPSMKELEKENLFLRYQIQVLQRQVGRTNFQQADRAFLTALALSIKNWSQACMIVKPDTILAWHRKLAHAKWTTPNRGRNPLPKHLRELVIRMKAENRLWGPKRIHGELLKLGFEISETSVRNILRRANLNPWNYTPSTTWKEFIQRHERVWAMDFFTVHSTFLKRMYVLVVMDLRSRVLITTKVTSHPTGEWVSNVLREQMFLQSPNGIIMDRDPAFSEKVLKNLLRSENVRIMRCPRRSPKANAFVERLNGTLQRECTDHFLFMNERQLQKILDEYREYYNHSRCHQGLSQKVPYSTKSIVKTCNHQNTRVDARAYLGGLHHEYSAVA